VLGLAPYAWTYLLGALALFGLTIVTEAAARRLAPAYRPALPWVGLFFALEWHLLWASMSGMETILHALIVTAALVLMMTSPHRHLLMGVLTGLSVWVRPDGLTLIGPLVVSMLLPRVPAGSRLRALGLYTLGLVALLLPYVLFNRHLGGVLMPNTFYAKQAEYAAWQHLAVPERLRQTVLQLLAGPAIILLPGVAISIATAALRRDWRLLAVATWMVGYIAMYVARLPPYQHGRYLMPAMPLMFLLGILGVLEYAQRVRDRARRLFMFTWKAALAVVAAAFLYLGARGFADDVGIIESEMVATARWSAENLPPGALVAAHDIGALGFFDQHQLLDLAGLISPEVVPFIRDEGQLAAFLDRRGADFLIAFPEFYPQLTSNLETVFVTGSPSTEVQGHPNMAIYRWRRAK
jgi:hypothetical protein